MAKQGSLSINSENIFPIIKKWLYSDHDIFIRELVSNGCDAVTKLKKLSVMGEFEEADDEKYKVEVRINPTDKTLTFIDNGIGMTEDEVDEYINQIAFSGAAAFMEQYKDKASDEQIIGHFGLGFYSAFMVADKVTIDTLSYKEGATPVHWECDGGTEFDMEDGDKAERGTTITLYLNDESYEFCNEYRCREILNKYCSFMPVEIYFVNEEEEAKKAEEAAKKDAEEKVIDVDVKDADTEDGDSEVTLEDEEEEEDDADRATWVIDGRTFLTHHIPGIDGYDDEKIEIQGKQVRVLHNTVTDVYLVYLFSDNGSYRDYFVYNPDTGNIVPYIEKQSGTDTVTFIEPEEGGYVPIRYSYVDMPWGAKYTVPAYKHVIIDGVDEIFDDTNRYLVYGVNQDGEKAWYSYDYDKDSLQLFDDVAYQGEQNYITELEDQDAALRTEADYQQNRYTTDMGRRLMIILVMTLIIIILLNAVVILTLRMKKMQMLPEKEDNEEEEDHTPKSSSYVTGSLEENESDFHDPEEDELEIIDLDNASDDDED